MEIIKIYNNKDKKEQLICTQYYNKQINQDKSQIEVNKPLKIMFTEGIFFTHEVVKKYNPCYNFCSLIGMIKTTNKIWIIKYARNEIVKEIARYYTKKEFFDYYVKNNIFCPDDFELSCFDDFSRCGTSQEFCRICFDSATENIKFKSN